MSDNSVPLNLRAARRSLRNVRDVEILGDWTAVDALWALPCRLHVPVHSDGPVSEFTDWFVVAGPNYPWDLLKVYPAKTNGITATFPHQSYNAEGPPEKPYRSGALCLNVPAHVLGRSAFDPEPFEASGPYSRLIWHIERALGWLRAADAGQLLAAGHPFELPEYPPADDEQRLTLAFQEGPESFCRWRSITDQCGLVELASWSAQRRILVPQQFQTLAGHAFLDYRWGEIMRGATAVERAAWLRLPTVPVLPPWQAPRTWGELRRVCRDHRIDLDNCLRGLFARLRDGKAHLLLVGFPIPKVVDGDPEQMHWLAIRLPVLSHGEVRLKGFRPGAPLAHWVEDQRKAVSTSQPIAWQNSENWAPHELGSRGSLPDDLTRLNVLLIGCGTVGCAVAELLVRAGLRRLTVMDDDTLKAGNLCRHTLVLPDVLESKAERLAARLRAASPHVDIVALNQAFPPGDAEAHTAVSSCDLILDCTADDQVIRKLAAFPWEGSPRFASIWLGSRARRVFCFTAAVTFPLPAFNRLVQPWLQQEAKEPEAGDFPREGMGCWHPVFPARADDVWLLVSAAVKHLEGVLSAAESPPRLAVFEQTVGEGEFTGLRRVSSEVSHA